MTEPVGLSINLPNQRVMQARVGDADIAVWRSVSGKLSAWLNRCPHRGMRLSHGFVRGESLACLYHGWHYGADGVCNYIPAHPELEPPATIQTTVFSIVDQGGVLWVSADGDPEVPSLAENNQPVRSVAFSCSIARTRNALFGVPISDDNGDILPALTSDDRSMVLLWASKDGSVSMTVLLQQVSPTKVIAHLLAAGDWSSSGLIRISRWSETVRREAERTDLDGGA